jgi:hypothetical protein
MNTETAGQLQAEFQKVARMTTLAMLVEQKKKASRADDTDFLNRR